MCRYEHELCQHDLRGLSKYEVNQHYFEFIRNANKEEREANGWDKWGSIGVYKCRICGDISFYTKGSFKNHLKVCRNNCNGAKRGDDSVVIGINDLATTRPQLAKEWHPTRNGDLKPKMVSLGSNKKVWWLGECGHEWEAQVTSRRNEECGCPYCSSHKVLEGFNDLATTHPDIAKEWHPTKNGDLKPNKVVSGSKTSVWWQCECGYEWEATVQSRAIRHTNCPCCSDGISYPEKLMAIILDKLNIEYTKQLTYDNGKHKYDFYIKYWVAIFETHGMQHYEQTTRKGARTLKEEQANDEYKYSDAINNGIKEEDYHQVDCRYSTLEWCRPNIEKALSKYVDVTVLTDEDWQEADIEAQKSIKIEVCKYWREQKEIDKDLTTLDVAKDFKISRNTIINYLKWGNENGLCTYNGEEESKSNSKRQSKLVYLIKQDGTKWFDEAMSQNELSRTTEILLQTISYSRKNRTTLGQKGANNVKYDPKYIGSYVVSANEWDSQHN